MANSNKHKSIFRSLPKFILLNASIALGIALFSFLGSAWNLEGFMQFSRIFIFSFFMSSALCMGGYKVDHYFDKKISWLEFPLRRLLYTTLIYVVYAFVASAILLSIYYSIFVLNSLEQFEFRLIFTDTIFSVGISLVIISIFITRSWLVEWKKSAVEAEQLKTELVENKYRALVQQLNPHFLFNSLNTLSNLVYEDADKSALFIRKLSQIYRYLLEVQHEELIELERELGFARDYLGLQQIRFEDSLQYEIEVDEMHNQFLPPLTIQLLLENAIKHNVFSSENPLQITIRRADDMLIITNNHHPKKTTDSTGVGLKNIKKRYEQLSNKQPKIVNNETEFRVELPLLQVSD